ncbi:YcnI family protein [Streptomyces sp. WMMC500]|uniref:YcnI family copper-binding membrane protein n=1 Tax=Streptomyces sp. WMMC500 TaxID=3015154 RepID=UPI00248CBA8B|nr:YcnI family protein [Streptomyces sp. WMMC500]WBB64564.1 YcnI family protein [Streptomyces sp. WMMC500]
MRRMSLATAVAAGAVLLLAGPAAAHVTVDPDAAEQGGYATVNFKVPNERDDASTVKLEVTLPAEHPLTSVMPQPVPGWDVKVEKAKLDTPIESHGEQITEAASKVTWSGGKIEPGTFQQFPVSMGALPEDADQLVFKAVQTYDSDEVVRWIEIPEEGAEEPELPAPVLALTPAADGGHGGAGDDAADDDAGNGDDTEPAAAEGDGTNDTAADDDGSSDTTARTLGIVGIVLGAGGVAFGVMSRRRGTGGSSAA